MADPRHRNLDQIMTIIIQCAELYKLGNRSKEYQKRMAALAKSHGYSSTPSMQASIHSFARCRDMSFAALKAKAMDNKQRLGVATVCGPVDYDPKQGRITKQMLVSRMWDKESLAV